MSAVGRVFCRELRNRFQFFKSYGGSQSRALSNAKAETSEEPTKDDKPSSMDIAARLEYRFIYPEFLPDPKPDFRNWMREKLERNDMMARRSVIDLPEFYVGSILAVTHSEPHAPGKSNRFVGICIKREGCGLRASFILRNVVDNQGVEVVYDLYDPNIQKIDVLRLEKRLDSHLLYLRDALPEYSTFPFTMEMELLPEGSPVPVNEIKVTLKPHPWLEKWERQNLKGISHIRVSRARQIKAKNQEKPWEKYDLMKMYRSSIPTEEQNKIWAQVYSELHNLEITRRKMKRKRGFVRPTKTA